MAPTPRTFWLASLATLAAGATIAACGGGAGPADGGCARDLPQCPPAPPSYQAEVEPILAARCVVCHYPGNPSSKLDSSTYAKVFADRGSILSQVYGCLMPPAGTSAPLDAEEKHTLLEWLVCGAPDN